jgi:hypothetical protein
LAISGTRTAFRRIFFQRCCYLFVLLLALIAIPPFLEPLSHGALIMNAINAFLIVSAVAAVGRSKVSFVIATLLAIPALFFHWKLAQTGSTTYHELWLKCGLALYAVTIFFLLRYVFESGVMSADRLSGAASGYLMMGVMWTFIYALVTRADPAAFSAAGHARRCHSWICCITASPPLRPWAMETSCRCPAPHAPLRSWKPSSVSCSSRF